jgi:hypothetical protein
LEAWTYWTQWVVEHASGKVKLDTHPKLAKDRSRWDRYDAINKMLERRRVVDQSKGVRARAEFEGSPLWVPDDWIAKWTPL